MTPDPSYNHHNDPPYTVLPADADLSGRVFAVLEKQWLTVNPTLMDKHMALVNRYGFDNWLTGFEITPSGKRHVMAYVEKCIPRDDEKPTVISYRFRETERKGETVEFRMIDNELVVYFPKQRKEFRTSHQKWIDRFSLGVCPDGIDDNLAGTMYARAERVQA